MSVVVVGAGPSGLATAAALGQAGIEALVLDRADRLGASWRGRYDRLHLHTVRWLSGLPGYRIPRSYGRWVSRDRFVEYLEAYAEHHGIEPRFGTAVERIERRNGGWRLTTSRGPLDADAAVVATGFTNVPYLPSWPGAETYARELLHSSSYANAEPYRGRDVLVVGSGNSGAEIATELAERGAARVRVAVRTPPNIVRRDTLGLPSQVLGVALRHAPAPVMNRVGAVLRRFTIPDLAPYGLPAPPGDGYTQFVRTRTVPILDVGFVDAVRGGRIEIVPAVADLAGSDVVLADGTRISPDAVIAATGFRPGLEPLVGHLGVLDEHGTPVVHGGTTHTNAPNLYFVGLTFELSGLLREAGKEARSAATAIASARTRAAA
ncbi:MAG: NAD(P)/FAD-dependent oxidoreductase [Actinomycetota bacterium]|nr:NAD(P)/FAD-dependent oxidoreductase [Actinomycetota bacterium]